MARIPYLLAMMAASSVARRLTRAKW
jgi:hypothetical protein